MTPEIVCKDVKKLLAKLKCNLDPFYVNYVPEAYREVQDCFNIVDDKVKKQGGANIYGWQIWKTSYLIEGEFHSIWRTEEGEYRDITPKPFSLNKILFVPDNNIKYEGKQIKNIIINLSKKQLVDDLIAFREVEFRINNKGERANLKEVFLSIEEGSDLKKLKNIHGMIDQMIHKGLSHQSQCLYESGLKYKMCHRKIFQEIVARYS
jgi:hypothetical protein